MFWNILTYLAKKTCEDDNMLANTARALAGKYPCCAFYRGAFLGAFIGAIVGISGSSFLALVF